jgi:hypothetical protein
MGIEPTLGGKEIAHKFVCLSGKTSGDSLPHAKDKVSSGRIRTTPNKSAYSNQNIIIHETFVSPERNLHIIGMNTTFAGLFSKSE